MTAMWTAFAILAGITLVAFTLGYAIGRLGEREAIARWLWDLPSSPTLAPWKLVEDIEHRVHRRKD